jgi:dsDNA-specific endonuclease/ATPase MutS2
MDAHTLDLLEFDRLRGIVAGYAATSLGRDAVLEIEPLDSQGAIDQRLQETDELLDLVRAGLGPPLGSLTDVRPLTRRAMTHATLSADEICQVGNAFRVIGEVSKWLDRNTGHSPRLASLKLGLVDFSSLSNTIDGCLDERGEVLDTASRRLSNIRGEIRAAESKIQATLRNLIRTLEARGLLRYSNYTMVGHHYVLPVIRDRRGEVSGSVQRTSASSETVYVEPAAIADQSAQLSFLKDTEKKEIRRILHWLSEQIGQVGDDLIMAVSKMADLDFALARARYAQDFRHFRPIFGEKGIFLRSARHPLLEHLFREEVLEAPLELSSDDEPTGDEPTGDETSTTASEPIAESSEAKSAKPESPDLRFAALPAGMSAIRTEPPKAKPKPPPPSPVFASLPKAGEQTPEPISEAGADEPEEPEDEPMLKGGLGVDYVALAEKRRQEKAAKAAARVHYDRPIPSRPVAERKKTTATLPKRQVTPIDIHLGFDYRIMVVTGPNTGGKTVALKTLGLLSVMAQCGLFIPAAEGSQVVLLDDVLTDIGDEQSLQQSLSTFSSHMKRVTAILGKATERTLVLLDEVGAGTDPAEGSALGRAIVDELDALGCLAVVTTHLGELKSIAFGNSRVRNANVEFDLESLKPLYHLRIGEAGRSHALTIARRLKLPGHVVDRAEEFLKQASPLSSAAFDDVQKLRVEAEKARQEALGAQADAKRLQEELEKALAEQRGRDRKAQELHESRERLKVGDRVVVPRLGYDRPGRVAKIDLKKRTLSISIGHMKWDAQVDEVIPLEDSPPIPPPKPQYRDPR